MKTHPSCEAIFTIDMPDQGKEKFLYSVVLEMLTIESVQKVDLDRKSVPDGTQVRLSIGIDNKTSFDVSGGGCQKLYQVLTSVTDDAVLNCCSLEKSTVFV